MTIRRLMAFVTVFALTTSSVFSQGVVASQQGTGSVRGERLVTLKLHDVSIRSALDEIVRQSGFTVALGEDVAGVNKTVSVSAVAVEPVDAVRAVIRNTGLVVKQVGVAKLMVVKGSQISKMAQGVITGRVIDTKNGRGVSGANISLDAQMQGVLSDENGSYRLTGVTSGAHTVIARLVGYAKQTKSITVGEGMSVTVDFRLEPSASVLNEVIVTGTVVSTELKAVPNAITVITAKQIEERGITRIDQLFRGEVPGLFAMELGMSRLDQVIAYSRGAISISKTNVGSLTGAALNTVPIKTYVDGVEVADGQYISQIDPKSIERIEILTGPQASTIYGANAINGVMQIFTKRGNTVKPKMDLQLSSGIIQNNFSSALAPSYLVGGSLSGVTGATSYNLGTGWNYIGAWTPGKQTQRVTLNGGGRYQSGPLAVDISTRQGWTITRAKFIALQTQTALQEAGVYRGITLIGAPALNSLDSRTLGVTMEYRPRMWWSHQLNIGRDAENTAYLTTANGLANRGDTSNFNQLTTNLRASQTYASTLQMSLASILHTTLTYGMDHWRSQTSDLNWSLIGRDITSPALTRTKNLKNSGAFLQGQFGLWDALFLTYGVRADWNPDYGAKARVRPGRYGVVFSRDMGIVSAKLRGSYGRSIRPPADGQRDGRTDSPNTDPNKIFIWPHYLYVPSPDLGPEFQQGGEGGLELYVGNLGSLVVTRYNQTVEGLINLVNRADSLRSLQPYAQTGLGGSCADWTGIPAGSDGYCYLPQSKYLNVGSIRNQGWELQGSVHTGPLTTKGTYSWTKSRVIGVTPKYRALLTDAAFRQGTTFSNVPEHTWAMNVQYAQGKSSVLLNVNGIGLILRDAIYGELGVITSSSIRLLAETTARMNLSSTYRQAVAGYTTANINAAHQFSSMIDGTLQITNLTNFYQNDWDARLPTAGRQTRIGLRWRIN